MGTRQEPRWDPRSDWVDVRGSRVPSVCGTFCRQWSPVPLGRPRAAHSTGRFQASQTGDAWRGGQGCPAFSWGGHAPPRHCPAARGPLLGTGATRPTAWSPETGGGSRMRAGHGLRLRGAGPVPSGSTASALVRVQALTCASLLPSSLLTKTRSLTQSGPHTTSTS